MYSRSTWFNLGRHNEPTDPPAPQDDPAPGNPDDEGLGDKGKQALDRMKAERAEAKRLAAAEKQRADELAAKVAAFEDRDKSDLEKATAASEAAQKKAEAATARAVRAEVKALAAESFADPTDAAAFLDLSAYADTDGEINTEKITADLTALLAAKPHLGRQTGPKPPKPDPGQGPRPPVPGTDFRTVDRATFLTEAAKLGVRLHS